MPFLGRLASLLVVGDEQAQVVGFQMGGLVKLEPKVDRDGFSVAWALPPNPPPCCIFVMNNTPFAVGQWSGPYSMRFGIRRVILAPQEARRRPATGWAIGKRREGRR